MSPCDPPVAPEVRRDLTERAAEYGITPPEPVAAG